MNVNTYYIGVGEPWDFISPDGKNLIKGKIVKIVNNDCVIFKANHLFKEGDVTSNILILISRYKDVHFDNIEKDNPWTVAGRLLFTNNYENMSSEELKKKSKYFIIGGLRKE